VSPAVPDFAPSTRGLHFPNSFPAGTPALGGIPASITIPGFGAIPVNDASNGLCGGMVFAVRDYFEAGQTPPTDTSPPDSGTPLFRFLVQRLIDSWSLPTGVLRYLYLMNPGLPDHETWFEPWAHGRGWIMTEQEWPKVRADIDGGRLSPLGLIRRKSWNPMDLSHQHQVLVYGYDLVAGVLTLDLYDPNNPDRDDVTMTVSLQDAGRRAVAYSPPDEQFPEVFCFFRVPYSPKRPPA
jgi:hypothetical protein